MSPLCKNREFRVLTVIVLMLIGSAAIAETAVWKISKNGNHVFIGGTVHLLSASDHPLPPEFEQAYTQAEHLVFEVDADAAQSLEAQQKLLAKAMFIDGRTLEGVLSPQTYALLDQYIQSTKLSLQVQLLNSFKPAFVAQQLQTLELLSMGMSPASGVDFYFNNKANIDGKSKGALETIDEQIDLIMGMGDGREDELIVHAINELKTVSETIADMKQAWRTGDMQQLAELMIKPMKDFPEIYQAMIVDRNKNWIPQIEAMFLDEKIEYVLVGCAHLAGNHSILKMLRDKGFRVEQL